MSEAERQLDGREGEAAIGADGAVVDGGDANDLRMAEVLRGSSSRAELRRELQADDTKASDDLLSRLNALDFVSEVIGERVDLPESIGGYEVRSVLGRGGMGTVYLGWQRDLEREVALKVLAPSFTSDPTMRKRFRAEAKATAALHHRHIVPIYDYGEAQGMLFFAMERVDGMSLDKHIAAARRIKGRPMAPLDCARRFAGVADALGLAHRRRLLHRDVKPGNILVAGDGTLALTDFGLAKALDHASMQLTSKGGGFLGTLHYASPEQALGRELTPASDLYSLGVTMFEAVTGDLPIVGKTTEALLQSILHGTPRRLREVLPAPPRDLEAVIEKLMSREPGDRYQDGEELARDLQRIADGEPVLVRRLPLHVRLWRRARKNPVLTGALVAVFVLVLATLALLFVLSREKGQSLVSRHQNNLAAIAAHVGREAGPPAGPAPLLASLTGLPTPAVGPSGGILVEFDQAERLVAGDEQLAAMRRAYTDDPLPAASALLQGGRGFEAMQLLDAAIQAAAAQRQSGSFAVELQLYGLYLMRGAARLTASVTQPNEARVDLALASYLRPGAVFPLALLDVLDIVQARDFDNALQRLRRELRPAAPERVRTVAQLLWTVAGLQPNAGANLMEFGLGFAKRRAVHAVALELLGDVPAPTVRRGTPTGLVASFADGCRQALEQINAPAQLRQLAASVEAEIDHSVHPDSPVQGWRHVVELLLRPGAGGALATPGPLVELAAWEDLVRLSPPRQLVRLWLPRFEELRREQPGLPGIVRVAALLHAAAGSPDAPTWADRWIVDADGDPEAYLCRMRLSLRDGQFERARDDATYAVQQAHDPAGAVQDVVAVCAALSAELEPVAAAAARLMAQQFRSVLDNGVQAPGGPR